MSKNKFYFYCYIVYVTTLVLNGFQQLNNQLIGLMLLFAAGHIMYLSHKVYGDDE